MDKILEGILVFMWIKALREKFNFCFFRSFFASIEKKIIVGGRLRFSWYFLIS